MDEPPRKKRKRRKASTIDRKYKCPYPECPRAYGTEGALKYHFKSKHKDQEYLPPPPMRMSNNESVMAPITVLPGRFSFPSAISTVSFSSQDSMISMIPPEFYNGLNMNALSSLGQSQLYPQVSKLDSTKMSLLAALPNMNISLGNGHMAEQPLSYHHQQDVSIHHHHHEMNHHHHNHHLGGDEIDDLEEDLDEDLDDD